MEVALENLDTLQKHDEFKDLLEQCPDLARDIALQAPPKTRTIGLSVVQGEKAGCDIKDPIHLAGGKVIFFHAHGHTNPFCFIAFILNLS